MTEDTENDRPAASATDPVQQPADSRVNRTSAVAGEATSGPFGRAALAYRGRGWPGTLPAKEGEDSKKPQLSGWLGNSGGWPKGHHVKLWLARFSDRNLLLRLNPGTVGIDVDAYEPKQGGKTLAELEAELGSLPATWRSSSRADDPVSGIRWFRAEPPEGRRWKAEAGPGIELVHATLRYAVVPPSIHPKTGQPYRWYGPDGERATCPRPSQLPQLPPAWVEALTVPDIQRPDEAPYDGPPKFTEGQQGTKYGRKALALGLRELQDVWNGNVQAWNPVLNRVAFAAGQLAAGGELDPVQARQRIEDVMHELAAPADQYKTLESAWKAGLAQPRSAPAQPESESKEVPVIKEEVAGESTPVLPADDAETVAELKRLRIELVEAQRQYLDLPDPSHVWMGLAAAATTQANDRPVWLLIVGSSSSGKTETGDLTADRASKTLDEVTVPGLLGWVREDGGQSGGKGKGGKMVAGGALMDLPRWEERPGQRRGLLVFSDLSNLLATSERGNQDKLFAFLRVVYDGRATRTISQAGGEGTGQSLVWKGRVTVVAACTKAIDNFSAHAGELGPRWVYFRLAERNLAEKRAAVRMANKQGTEPYRDKARKLAARIIDLAASRLDRVELSDELCEAIEDALLVTGYGRGSVPRSGYGAREVIGMADSEEPGRITKQLTGLATGLLALGLDESEVTRLIRKCALDSMPEMRARVLRTLATADKPLSTAALAKAAGMSRPTAKRNAEDLELIGVVDANREGPEPAEGAFDMRKCSWELEGEEGDLIRDVFRLAVAEGWR